MEFNYSHNLMDVICNKQKGIDKKRFIGLFVDNYMISLPDNE